MTTVPPLLDFFATPGCRSAHGIREITARLESGEMDIPDIIFDEQSGGYGLLSRVVGMMRAQPSAHKSGTIPRTINDVDRDPEALAIVLWQRGVRPVHKEEEAHLLYYTMSLGADRIFGALWASASMSSRKQIHEMLLPKDDYYPQSLQIVRMGHVQMCKTLLDLGLLDIHGRYGIAKLPLASMLHHREMLDLLVERGLDPSLRDAVGRQAPAFWPRQISRNASMMGLWHTWWKRFEHTPGVDDIDKVAGQAIGAAIELGRDAIALKLVARHSPNTQGHLQGRSVLQHAIDMCILPTKMSPALVVRKPMSQTMCLLALRWWNKDKSALDTILPEGISEGFRFVISSLQIQECEEREHDWRQEAYLRSAEAKIGIKDQFKVVRATAKVWRTPIQVLFNRWVHAIDYTSLDTVKDMANFLSSQEGDLMGEANINAFFSKTNEVLENSIMDRLVENSVEEFLTLDRPDFWMGRLVFRLPNKVDILTTDPQRAHLPAWRRDGHPHWSGQIMIEALINKGLRPSADSLSNEDPAIQKNLDEIRKRWPAMVHLVDSWCMQAHVHPSQTHARKKMRL